MVEPPADDAAMEDIQASAQKHATEEEAERELLTWGGSIKSEGVQSSPKETAEQQREHSSGPEVKPVHDKIHTPPIDVAFGSDTVNEHDITLGPTAPLESIASPRSATPPDEDREAGTKTGEPAVEPASVMSDKASAASDAQDRDVALDPAGPLEGQTSSKDQPVADTEAVPQAGILPLEPATEVTEPVAAMGDETCLQKDADSRGVDPTALHENKTSLGERFDGAARPSERTSDRALIKSDKASPKGDNESRSVKEHLDSLSSALAGVHSDVHRIAAESRKVDFQFQAIGARQADLEKAHSDLSLRLHQLEAQLQSFADSEVSPLTWSYGNLHERVASMERAQKTVAKGVRRMLQNAPPNIQTGFPASIHQPGDANWSPSGVATPAIPSSLPTPAAFQGVPDILENLRDQLQHHEQRIAELDAFCSIARMEMRVPRSEPHHYQDHGSSAAENTALIERRRELQAVDLATLRRDVDALLQGETSELLSSTAHGGAVHQPQATRSWRTPLLSQETDPSIDQTSLELRFDTRLDASLQDVRQRLELLRQAMEQCVQFQLAELSRQVPQATARIDNLTLQCQNCIAKVEAHDVRIDMLSTALDLQERRLQSTVERVERSATTTTATRVEREAALVAATTVLTGRVDAHEHVLEHLRDRLLALSGHVKLRAASPAGQGFPSPVSSTGSAEKLLDVVAASRLEPLPWPPNHSNGCAPTATSERHTLQPGNERGLIARAPMR